jgi:hypothetical protein
MVTWANQAIVLGLTGKQGTYKFYNLATGKIIKRPMFTPYPMPDSVIKKVETFSAGKQDGFDFANHNGALFQWNDEVDLVKKDIVLHPYTTAEFSGVALMRHITLIKEEFEPHSCIKDAAALETNFGPVAIAGVDARAMHANSDKINYIGNNDSGIIHVGNIHPNQHPAQNLIVMLDSSDNDHNYNKGGKFDNDEDVELENYDLSDNNNNDNDDKDDSVNQAHVLCFDDEPSQEDDKTEDQGVRRSRHKNRRVTDKYAYYTLLMETCFKKCGGKCRAIIPDDICFFLGNGLSDAKPILEKYRYEYALGVALVTYSIGAGIKKFKEQGEAGVSKELIQMHNMSVFCPVTWELLSKEERKKALALLR